MINSKIINYFIGFNKEISTTLFSFFPKFSLFFYIFIFIVFIFIRKNAKEKRSYLILLFFFLSTMPLIFFLKGATLEQFFSGTSLAIILLFIFALEKIQEKFHFNFSFIMFFCLLHLLFLFRYDIIHLKSIDNVFYHMPYKEITFGKQKEVIEYALSFSSPFTLDAFTTPLYRPEAWHYLNAYYQRTLGWKPKNNNKLIILVIEPFTDKFWLKKWLEKYDKISIIIKTKYIKNITVQIRKNK
jgi:hypothetical protein